MYSVSNFCKVYVLFGFLDLYIINVHTNEKGILKIPVRLYQIMWLLQFLAL